MRTLCGAGQELHLILHLCTLAMSATAAAPASVTAAAAAGLECDW
jgi:hypothetical protein